MIDLSAFAALATMDLGPMSPKPTSVQGNQTEASVTLASHNGGKVEIGVWECTPGRFTADRSRSAEFCLFIAGKVEMTHVDGTKLTLGAGDAIDLPLGWKGEWRVIEHVRKLYVITQG
ncbi:MAG: DUF861 domain-containing protein [Tabrizicola sp.]|nr:DUF861 domain-containing protein [Tabrizicola sp.]